MSALALGLAGTGCTTGSSNDHQPEHAAGPPVVHEAALGCDEGTPLATELSSGAVWSLCVHIDAKRGTVLRNVHFTPAGSEPIEIAHEISLAQLEVPYDDGDRVTRDITSIGFGGIKLQTLAETECPARRVEFAVPNIGDGSKFGETPVRDVLCSEVTDAGLAYRSEENGEVVADRRDQWRLWSISKVGWYEYVSQYTFGADGSITPALGATGDLSPVDFTDESHHGWPVGTERPHGAVSHAHNAVWRIHWALGDGPHRVEQYDASPTGDWGEKSPMLRGRLSTIARPATAERADRRWWRVLSPESLNDDGHPVSYQIDVGATDGFTFTQDEKSHGADAGYDVAFTNVDECQVFASDNDGRCGKSVLDYVAAGSDDPLTDVVSWVAVGFHHVPRDEDQSPMELHWQGFTLTPRDLTAQRVDVPEDRAGYNGQPEEWNGEPVEELEQREDPLS